jgi:hypothetical protein
MGRSLSASNGNDKIMTPLYLCKQIVEHFNPQGTICEPCSGTDNFLKYLVKYDKYVSWFEIDKNKDFLEVKSYNYHFDWIITNPPYSKYRDFLKKSMEVADNIVYLQLINATFYKARLRDVREAGFGIKEIWCIDTPKEFPQFGFQMGCVYYKRDWDGDTKITLPNSR